MHFNELLVSLFNVSFNVSIDETLKLYDCFIIARIIILVAKKMIKW